MVKSHMTWNYNESYQHSLDQIPQFQVLWQQMEMAWSHTSPPTRKIKELKWPVDNHLYKLNSQCSTKCFIQNTVVCTVGSRKGGLKPLFSLKPTLKFGPQCLDQINLWTITCINLISTCPICAMCKYWRLITGSWEEVF